MKYIKVLTICLLYHSLNSCAPKLTFTQIEQRINTHYTAFHEFDIEYEFKNTPVKYVKGYGEDGYKKKIQEIIKLRKKNKYPPQFSYGELRIQDINKCNSTYFYKVKYLLDKTQYTPHIDSTALAFNYNKYGRKHVNFLPNAKILQTREKKEKILVLDKDKEWKLLSFNTKGQWYDRYYKKGFSKCIQKKVSNSSYLPYW